ncbi:prepilin-type N-terminal cleavage/methylation domain-containing protein [Ralstonia sp. A12]|uniref:prepilin-type N-terminal cleavage/methylation domain-containing protein n=1 Tax=Ralstonia sp. A12 TaxID=1217052 RepID=UPI0012ED0E2D|nr:prepilin-type N-terminal cleavage/methylation domain-containing protein [Ralstonia sp. A12]
MPARYERGVTLVEIAVVLVIVSLLVFAIVPLSGTWITQANVNLAQTLLIQGAAHAKARALRNPNNATSGDGAAFLLLINRTVCVQTQAPSSINCAGAIWSASMPIAATLDGAETQCIGYSNVGIPIPTAISGTSCSTAGRFNLTSGGANASGMLN